MSKKTKVGLCVSMQPCTGCAYDPPDGPQRARLCTHPSANNIDWWTILETDGNGYPHCYTKESTK